MLRKEIMNKLVVDLLQQKGLGCWKVLKKRCKQKGEEKCFLSSQTRWSWQIKRACTSFWTCSSSPGHWSHTQEPSSCHAAASTFKVCARKRNLLILRITWLDRSRWRYRGTLIGIRTFLEKGWQTKNNRWPVCCCACWGPPTQRLSKHLSSYASNLQ